MHAHTDRERILLGSLTFALKRLYGSWVCCIKILKKLEVAAAAAANQDWKASGKEVIGFLDTCDRPYQEHRLSTLALKAELKFCLFPLAQVCKTPAPYSKGQFFPIQCFPDPLGLQFHKPPARVDF